METPKKLTPTEKLRDFLQALKGLREFYSANELYNAIRRNMTVWSWGAHAWKLFETVNKNQALLFKVQGHHHKGYVMIVVNGADLFDVYLFTNGGEMKEKLEDIHVEDLIDRIDRKVERLDSYVR